MTEGTLVDQEFHHFSTSEKCGRMERRVAVAIGGGNVGTVLDEIAGDFQAAMQRSDVEGHRTALGILSVNACAVGNVAFGSFEVPTGDGGRQELRRTAPGVIELAGQSVRGGAVVGDLENEIVAEEAVRVLDLEQVDSRRRHGCQSDDDGFPRLQGHRAGDAAAVDDQAGILAEVAASELHPWVAGVQDGEFLAAALFLDGTKRPERGLRVVHVRSGAETGGEGPDETTCTPPSCTCSASTTSA